MNRMRLISNALAMGIALLLFLSAAVGYSEAPDWSAYDGARTIEVLTQDEDGAPRETTIWVVVVNGAAYINTNATTWGENVERTPRLDVRQAQSTRSFDILFLEDPDARHLVQAAFRGKYGWQDSLLSLVMDESEAVIMELVPTGPVAIVEAGRGE